MTQTESLSKPVAISTVAHVALVAFFLFRAYMAPSEIIDLKQSIRVDIVGLPEKAQTLPEQAPPPAPATPAPAPVAAKPPPPKPLPAKPKAPEPPKVDLHPKKDLAKSEKNALSKIKAMAALDKIQNEVAKEKAASKPVRGNQVNAGNSLTGTDKIDYQAYYTDVKTKLVQNWSLPQWLINSPFKGSARVLIDENGAIKKRQIEKSSGNSEFDDHMLDAIDRSAPFPAPPARLRGVLSVEGIVFAFPQRGDS